MKFSEVVKEAKEKGFTELLPETSRTRTCQECKRGEAVFHTFGGVVFYAAMHFSQIISESENP